MDPLDRALAACAVLALLSLVTASPPLAAAGLGLLVAAAGGWLATRSTSPSGWRTIDGVRIVEGGRVQSTIQAEGRVTVPALVRLRDQAPEIAEPVALPAPRTAWGRFHLDHQMSFELPVRGKAGVGPLILEVLDPLALTLSTVELQGPDAVRVWPRAEDLRDHPLRSRFQHILSGPHLVRNPGSSLEFYGLRDYLPGDSMRSINWKASARAQEMMVNQYEHETHGELNVFVDNRRVTAVGTGRLQPSHEVCRTAATLARLAWAERDILQAYAFGEPGVASFKPDPGASWRDQFMDWLAGLTPAGDHDASVLFGDVVARLTPRSMVVFVSPLVGDRDPLGDAPFRALALENSVLVLATALPEGLDPELREGLGSQRRRWIDHFREAGMEVVDMDAAPDLATALVQRGAGR